MKLSDKTLRKRDATRDIGAEILQAVRDIKAGRGKRIAVTVPPAAAAHPPCVAGGRRGHPRRR